jgi:tetratricopeptide (TPR) repeat protein
MTGEVVTGTEERLATGDAVNVAARFEQAAAPGEVLIGEPTLALVRNAVEFEPVEPLILKGKADPVPAYRLLRAGEAPERLHEQRFVGRDRELALLRETWDRVRSERRCELVTVVGEAGVGKSRLAAETLATVDATVVRARCLPYGDGITYWPVVEVLKQLDLVPADEAAATAIRSVLGESDAHTSGDEIAWAFRKTLEQAAEAEPLVVVVDDIQWGMETFHDLLEQVPLLSTEAPILVLCLARPELVERRPTWPITLRLEPLGDASVAALIGERVSDELRERITHAAGGNPLFVAEMLAIAGGSDRDVVVPPTLRALLSTRLDQLEPEERGILERGAIEGEIFHRGAVQALSPDGTPVTQQLASLVRKQLIRPDRPQLAGEDAFRFRHLLIRDAAYDGMPKAARAGLHERYASWLGQHSVQLVEVDEIVGYHLEQASRYLAEVGTPDDGSLAAAARRHLAAGAHRAARYQDYRAAVPLFERAIALAPRDELDLGLETELGDALVWIGKSEEALRRANALAARAAASGDRIVELCGQIRAGVLSLYLQADGASERLTALLPEALPVFEAADDDLALHIAYAALGEEAETRLRNDEALEAYERAFMHAERAGHPTGWALGARAARRFLGTTPAIEVLDWIDQHEPDTGRDFVLRAFRANTLAMLGRFDEARAILAEDRAVQEQWGGGTLLANLTAFESVWLELRAGDPAAAASFAAEGWRLHREVGESGFHAHAAGERARALYALDRLDEADEWAARAADGASEGQSSLWAGVLWRTVRAKVLARRGLHGEAERLASEAIAIVDGSDMLDLQGDAYADLGEVLLLAAKRNEAEAALRQALDRYERKGNLVSTQLTRERLVELRAAAR